VFIVDELAFVCPIESLKLWIFFAESAVL